MTAGNARREASSSLSVIMACDGALHEIPDRLDALARACAGIPTDVFIVQASDARVVIPADAPIPTHRVIATSALGACHSGSGPVVAQAARRRHGGSHRHDRRDHRTDEGDAAKGKVSA